MQFTSPVWPGTSYPGVSPNYFYPNTGYLVNSTPSFPTFNGYPLPTSTFTTTALPLFGNSSVTSIPISEPPKFSYDASAAQPISNVDPNASVQEAPSNYTLPISALPPLGSLLHSQFNRPVNWLPTTVDTFPSKSEVAQEVTAQKTEAEVLHAKGPVVISYFPIKARAFFPLLVAEVGNIEYEWKKIAMEDWPALKPTTPFGQLPLLEHGNITIAQGSAIATYIGRLAGLLGSEDADFATSQMLVAQYEDMVNAMAKQYQSANRAEDMEKYFSEKLPSDLAKLEKLVAGGFTNERTIGELAIFAFLNLVLGMEPNCLDGFSALSAFYRHLAAEPKVAAFLADKAGPAWFKKDW